MSGQRRRRGKSMSSVIPMSSFAGGAVRSSLTWQMGGYHGELTDLHALEGIHRDNDHGYVPMARAALQGDGLDPFEDYAVDPSMVNERSEDLVEHQGKFWLDEKERMKAEEIQKDMASSSTLKRVFSRVRRISDHHKRMIHLLLLILMIAMIILTCARWMIFNITSIQVEGNDRVQTDEIVRLSGIQKRSSSLHISEETVKAGIESNRYLRLSGIERTTTHKITLRVREREAEAYIMKWGIIYTMDHTGMILEEDQNKDLIPALVKVEGLDIQNCMVGKILSVRDSAQMEIFSEMMLQLKAMEMQSDVTEIYLNDLQNIFLVTKDGYSVRLGGSERVHAKLRSMNLTLAELQRQGVKAGTIDVSNPEIPTYVPESSL